MSYSPMSLVRHMHDVPHLDIKSHGLDPVSNTFGIYDGNYYNSYVRSLFPLPSIIAAIGILALFILSIALCMRCCCTCCQCKPSEETTDDGRRRLLSSDSKGAVYWPRVICVFAFFVIFVDQSMFFGNRDLNSALRVVDNAMNFLEDSFTTLNNDGLSLETLGGYLLGNATAADNSGCNAAGTIINDIEAFNADVVDYVSYVDPLPGYINQAQNAIHDFAVDDKNYSIFVLYAVSFMAALLFVLGLYGKNKLMLQCNMMFTMVLILVLIILCCAEMIILVGLADFCMSPVPNTLQVMSNTSDTYEVTSYYATCVGVAPFNASLTSAQAYATFFTDNVATLEAACPGNPYVLAMASELPTINYLLDSITNETECAPYQQKIESVLQHGVCHSGYLGFFTIWASQYFTAFALFCLVVAASVAYQYFEWTNTSNVTVQSEDQTLSTKLVYNHATTPEVARVVDPVAANSSYNKHSSSNNDITNRNSNSGHDGTLVYGTQGTNGRGDIEF